MPNTGDILVGTGENLDRSGGIAWLNPTRVTADDASSASCNPSAINEFGDYLVGRNCGFALGSAAIAQGFVVTYDASKGGSGNPLLNVQLQDDAGALVGTAKTVSITGTGIYVLGGLADLWGTSLTYAQINNANFGVRAWFDSPGVHSVQVDCVKIGVEYSEPVSIDPDDVGTGAPVVGSPTLSASGPVLITINPLFTGAPFVGGPNVFLNIFPIDPFGIHSGVPRVGTPTLIVSPALPAGTKYAQFFLNSSSCVVQIECVEFIHPDFSVTHRAVRNVTAGITVTHEDGSSNAYLYYPLRILPSKVLNDLDFGLKIEFGDLGEALPAELDLIAQADGYDVKPIVKLRVYRSDDLTKPLHGPLVLEVSEFNFTRDGASFEALARRMNVSRTGEIYSLTRFPTLRGFL